MKAAQLYSFINSARIWLIVKLVKAVVLLISSRTLLVKQLVKAALLVAHLIQIQSDLKTAQARSLETLSPGQTRTSGALSRSNPP